MDLTQWITCQKMASLLEQVYVDIDYFHALLNIGGNNSQIIYQTNTDNKKSCFQFIKTLRREFMEEHV